MRLARRQCYFCIGGSRSGEMLTTEEAGREYQLYNSGGGPGPSAFLIHRNVIEMAEETK